MPTHSTCHKPHTLNCLHDCLLAKATNLPVLTVGANVGNSQKVHSHAFILNSIKVMQFMKLVAQLTPLIFFAKGAVIRITDG